MMKLSFLILSSSLALEIPYRPLESRLDVSSRRQLIHKVAFLATASSAWLSSQAPGAASTGPIVSVRVSGPSTKLGVELYDVKVGTESKVAIKSVVASDAAARGLQKGMILKDYRTAQDVADRFQQGPYPIDLEFLNLAAGGDAFGEMGRPLVTAEDALELAKKTAEDPSSPTGVDTSQVYTKRVLKEPPNRILQSRRGDTLEINYVANIAESGEEYDSSAMRGTGQPYQMVLGSGDMIPGVDLGLYDMSPGELRQLEIPEALGHGPRGRKNFGIPDGSSLVWTIELVSVNGAFAGGERTRDDIEGRVPYD